MQLRKITLALAASLLLLCPFLSFGQTNGAAQTLKGSVIDKSVKTELIGATVQVLPNGNPTATPKGTATDVNGRFKIAQLPLGKYTVLVRYLGYKEVTLSNVTLIAGKETDLVIEMEESVVQGAEVVITAQTDKRQPLNELATVSTRTFSVEETQRFAAAVNDPARMAASYAGVVAIGDGNNHIVIRGNSPGGLLWRMEGVDIPNPNHFSSLGTSGGGISILSAQLLTNSDFSTGAFAAEYGNALSGVFDLRLRKGNSERREFTLQAGVLGLDAAAEGPLRLGGRTGSYLVNYRYSTLSLVGKLGVPLGNSRTDFQDLSFNVWMPAGRAGTFTLFGFGGLSKQTAFGEPDSAAWREDLSQRYPGVFRSNTGAVGLTHSKVWGSNTYLKTVVAASRTDNGYDFNQYLLPDYTLRLEGATDYGQQKVTVSSVLNHKFNARHLLRVGGYTTLLNYNFGQYEWDSEQSRLVEQVKAEGNTQTINAFAQWQYRPTERLTVNTGVHSLTFLLNNKVSVEPRVGVKYALSGRQTLSVGYGLHSQIQTLSAYFVKDDATGQLLNPDLGFSKSHHFVASFDQSLTPNLHWKTELYYQHLFQVPVSRGASTTFALLNQLDTPSFEALENTGRGRNYGLEITLEQFLSRGLYFLSSTSLYRSEYRGSDQVWRSTRFDSRVASTFTAGKEWPWTRRGKDRTFGLNVKLVYSGGLRSTPVDVVASQAAGETVYQEDIAFSEQMPYYFRVDTGVRLKRNYRRATTTLSLDVQNTTNRKNVFDRYYDPVTYEVKYYFQAPLIPILAYKIEF